MTPFKRCILPNGLTFLYRQSPGLPLVAATLLLRTGSCYETPRVAGLANLTCEVMLKGTRRRSALRIAEAIESVGASLGVQASEDYTEVGFVAPIDSLKAILDVWADVITQPSFPLAEIKKERASVLASLKSRKDSIFNVAFDRLNTALFGDHPYGRPIDGIAETVEHFTRDDLKNWHERHFRPDRAILSMISPLPFNPVKHLLEIHLKAWKKRTSDSLVKPSTLSTPQTNRPLRLEARFEQAYFMTGVLAPAVLEPDYATLKVLNTFWGGGMSSRLFLRLREEMGLAYEVSSFSPTHLLPSQWVIYLGLPPGKLSVAKKELEKLLEELQRKSPPMKEIRQAVAMIKGSYLMEHQTRRRQAWYAAWWEFLGKGPDGGRRFLEAVEEVTPEHVRALARRLLAQPRVTVEVVPRK